MSKPLDTPQVGMIVSADRIEAGLIARKAQRESFILRIMAEITSSLGSDVENGLSLQLESANFVASATSEVDAYTRSGIPTLLIDYTADTNTRASYPFLDLPYLEGLVKNYEHIVARLSE